MSYETWISCINITCIDPSSTGLIIDLHDERLPLCLMVAQFMGGALHQHRSCQGSNPRSRTGRFSKVSRTFWARKAGCQTAMRLFWKLSAYLLRFFWCKKNQEDCEVWWLRNSALRRYKGNKGTRNRPQTFRDFWDTGPRPEILGLFSLLLKYR